MREGDSDKGTLWTLENKRLLNTVLLLNTGLSVRLTPARAAAGQTLCLPLRSVFRQIDGSSPNRRPLFFCLSGTHTWSASNRECPERDSVATGRGPGGRFCRQPSQSRGPHALSGRVCLVCAQSPSPTPKGTTSDCTYHVHVSGLRFFSKRTQRVSSRLPTLDNSFVCTVYEECG